MKFLFLFFIYVPVFAQNLVPNPSFEEHHSIPCVSGLEKNIDSVAVSWFSANNGSPDYYHVSCLPEVKNGINASYGYDNGGGFQQARTGKAYAGLKLWDVYYPEYIEVKLKESLKQNSLYKITFHVSMADQCGTSLYSIGAGLFSEKIYGNSWLKIALQIANEEGRYITDTSGWVEISGLYFAQGGEQFLVIGNSEGYSSHSNAKPSMQRMEAANRQYSYYYYLDDVSVTEVSDSLGKYSKVPCDPLIKTAAASASYPAVIYFDSDRSELLPSALATLDSLWEIAEGKKIKKVELSGHADTTGNEAPNIWLSENRSAAAEKYFLSKGIGKKVIASTFSGSRKAAAENATSEGRQKNRRTEIKITTEETVSEWSDVKAGDKLVLKNIYFEGNKAVILPASAAELKKLLDFLISSPCTKIEIQGHVNAAGIIDYRLVDTVEYKEKLLSKTDPWYHSLSEARAKAVFDYLVRNGISPVRLRHRGFGCSQMVYPLAKNEREMQMNRRVEILVLEK
jgi:outer membrane protein OmpA-like peptidoglycan-associated protein